MKKKLKTINHEHLWKKAKKLIPGGNMFLSKRPELYLPTKWPTYYKKAKGCYIWDLNNKKYIDFSMMGIGTNILGYSNKKVDSSVIKKVLSGSMSTLNSVDEIELAEKLVKMHPWSSSAKFARTGGEANAIAVRISRAFTKKENVAVCGYHGWHDWYQAANFNSKYKLDKHLIEGLKLDGVSKNLKNTVYSFNYNNFYQLERLIRNKNIGTVIMEVKRNEHPKNNFLEKVRDITKKNKIVLIFDECSSGFRESYGGLHKVFKINPDLCMFGKALGNGYAINAVIGRDEIMKFAKKSFISSTFWSEGIGPVAALKTLQIMKEKKTWKYISSFGSKIKKLWRNLSIKYELDMHIQGLDALPSFYINSKNFLKYKTFLTQEMMKNNFLCSNIVYVCTEHNLSTLKQYNKILEKIFYEIKMCEDGKDINKLLKYPVCETNFRRLN